VADPAPLDSAIRRPGRWRVAVQVALAVGGVAVIAYFLHTVEPALVRRAIGRLAAWIPVLLALEGARIAVEAAGTRALYGLGRERLPTGLLVRSHVVGYGLAFYMPAGRAAAEAVKATMLARCATPARAAAVAAANQSMALLGLAIAAVVCAAGASAIGAPELVASLLVVAAVTGGLGVAVRVATLRLRGGWVRRFAPKIATLVDDARGEVPRWVPLPALAAFLASRVLQLAGIAVLLYALAGEPTLAGALAADGVGLVGASIGDLVPGQLGATDATFSVSAGLVGLSPEAALSIALVIHLVQMAWLGIALVMELVIRVRGARGVRGA
jgi:hypothetical protein